MFDVKYYLLYWLTYILHSNVIFCQKYILNLRRVYHSLGAVLALYVGISAQGVAQVFANLIWVVLGSILHFMYQIWLFWALYCVDYFP